MQNVKVITKVGFIIAFYYLSYYLFMGFLNPLPLDGDSWDYHIPIALSILNGSFLNASFGTIPRLHNPVTGMIHMLPQWYYPASSEAINAIFILFHVPTFSNIFAAIVLFFSCWKLGLTFRLSKYYSILFALSIVTSGVIVRWLNSVSIDVWVGVWFVLSLILLEKPKKSVRYFATVGFVLGMLVGSKYTALYFFTVLIIFYAKRLVRNCNFQRTIAFIIPFSIFGLFWYSRNFILTANPFYPLARFGFPGPYLFNDTIWNATLHHPFDMFNANFGEYHLWLFSAFVAVIALINKFVIKKNFQLDDVHKIFLIGFINVIFYFNFPANSQVWIMVSSVRYSIPAFIPLILGVFMVAAKYKKEELIGYVTIANMINVLSMAFYPKLILFYLPVSLLAFYLLDREKT